MDKYNRCALFRNTPEERFFESGGMMMKETVVLVLLGIVAATAASSKPVSITLTSNWARTPILLEARHDPTFYSLCV